MNPEIKELGPEYAILVDCPHCIELGLSPNPEHAHSADLFFHTEVGHSALMPLIERAEELKAQGVNPEEAVETAFKDIAVRDEDEVVIRLGRSEIANEQLEFNEERFVAVHQAFNKSEGQPAVATGLSAQQTEIGDQDPENEKIVVDNFSYSETGGAMQVIGSVTNNDSMEQPVTLRAVFYDKNGQILGTSRGQLDKIGPGKTQSFSLTIEDDVAGYSRIDVRAEA